MADGRWKGKTEWLSAMGRCAPALASHLEAEFSVATDQMVALAQALCPTQADAPFHQPPGTLRASIHAQVDVSQSGRYSFKVVAGAGAAFYGRFVEFGTRAEVKGGSYINKKGRKRKTYRTHPGTAPHPFFWPAYHQTMGQVHADLNRIVGEAMTEAAGS